jgi:hypothetical protein
MSSKLQFTRVGLDVHIARPAIKLLSYDGDFVARRKTEFAMEELPPEFLLGTYLEVEEQRFNGQQIRLLYESRDYPLPRKLPLRGALHDIAAKTSRSAR